MTDFPASILKAATTTVSKISSRMESSSTLGDAATEIIAEAIAAEQAKALDWCVSVCDHALEHYKGPVAMKIRREIAVRAAAIRSGEQP